MPSGSRISKPREGAPPSERANSPADSRKNPRYLKKNSGASSSTIAEARRSVRSVPSRIRSSQSPRSEEHTSELQSLMRISYAVLRLKKKNKNKQQQKSQ